MIFWQQGVGAMNIDMQAIAPLASRLGPDSQPFADRLVAALATLKEDQN